MVDMGKRLYALRTERGWTQKQLADRIGATPSIISAYETGTRKPSYEALVKLASLFSVSTDYLLGVRAQRIVNGQFTVSLGGLSPEKRTLVIQLIHALEDHSALY